MTNRTRIRRSVALLSSLLGLIAVPAHSATCIATGATLSAAKQHYKNQCVLPRKDCDKINGVWYCASESINASTIGSIWNTPDSTPITPQTPPQVTSNNTVASALYDNICVDTDGDGWGWDGVKSCKMGSARAQTSANSNTSILSAVITPTAATGNDCVDSDGDGWGWDGQASCKIISTPATIDYRAASYNTKDSEVPANCAKLNSGDYHITELVTDVILTAGQSNAAGAMTKYEPQNNSKDRVNARLLAWTENHQWEIANPSAQSWHNGKYPGGQGHTYNHPAFQIGRAITERDECRVVAFIATAAPGQPIDYWRYNQDNHYKGITATVTAAINALPVKHQIDMIWWMQGEADNDQYIDRYYNKLQDLITKFRSESWFPYNGYFLANETGWFVYANQAIQMLNQDNDPFTDYSRGADSPADPFPNRSDENNKVHFNEVSLRKIGDLVADKYLNTFLKSR